MSRLFLARSLSLAPYKGCKISPHSSRQNLFLPLQLSATELCYQSVWIIPRRLETTFSHQPPKVRIFVTGAHCRQLSNCYFLMEVAGKNHEKKVIIIYKCQQRTLEKKGSTKFFKKNSCRKSLLYFCLSSTKLNDVLI